MNMLFSDSCSEEDIPRYIPWSTVAISSFLCVITVPGNLLTCIAIIKDPYRDLRTPFNYFVINLAAADLIVGCVTEPGFIIYHIKEAIEGKKLHVLWIFHLTYFMSLTASLLSLSALTVDRCLTITSPLRRRLNPRHGYLTSAVIWGVSLTVPLIYFLVKFYVFLFVFANTQALVVFVILVISHKRIAKTMQDHVRHWDLIKNNDFRRRALARERQVTRSFLMMLALFCSAVFPSCVITYVIGFCTTCSCDVINTLRDVYFLLPMVISATNHLLYSMRMRNFRRAFALLFTCTVFQKIRPRPRYWVNKNADGSEGKVNKKTLCMGNLSSEANHKVKCSRFKPLETNEIGKTA